MNDYGGRRYRFSIHGQRWSEYRRLRRRRRNANFERPFKFSPGDTITLGPIIDHDNLLATFDQMASEGGQAPGPDGIRFEDLGRRERGDICRDVSTMIASGYYLPGPASRVEKPKPNGGTRTLMIRNIGDRVVSKALTNAITPVIDSRFLDCSMGFRLGRNLQQLLAGLEAAVVQQGFRVVVTDDIRKAFDNVLIDSAVAAFARHVNDPDAMRLIEGILRGYDGESRQVGIDQGDALSPLTLNLLLDLVLDRPLLAACQDIPFRYHRYADNLAFLARNVSEGHRVLHETRQLLDAAGFALKGEHGPVDLRRQGAHVEILGFRIRRHSESRLTYELTEESWWNLEQHVSRAHDVPEPAKTANLVLRGWLEAHGPAFGDAEGRDIVDRVLRTASQVGFWEVESEEELLRVVGKARERWLRIHRKALSSDAGVHGGFSSPVYGADALRASPRARSPPGDAEAGLTGYIPAQTGSFP